MIGHSFPEFLEEDTTPSLLENETAFI